MRHKSTPVAGRTSRRPARSLSANASRPVDAALDRALFDSMAWDARRRARRKRLGLES